MFRILDLDINEPGTAPASPEVSMMALSVIEPEGPHHAQLALDTLPPSGGGRVLLELGLQGGDTMVIPDGEDPVHAGNRKYPDNTTLRTAGRMLADLTPGHIVAMQVLGFLSGPTEADDGEGGWAFSGAGGLVRLQVVYTSGDATQIVGSVDLDLPASVEPYAGVPTPAMPAIVTRVGAAAPWGPNPSAATLEPFLRGGATADIKVSYLGSPRPVDVVVYEYPLRIVVDTSDSEWPTAMYADGGDPYPELPSEWPLVQLDASDPGGGTEAIARALEQAGNKYGPHLVWWSSATEHVDSLLDWISYGGGTGDDEAPPLVIAGASPLQLPYGVAYNANMPAWALGHYARIVEHGDEFYDGRTGVLPVWVDVYAKVDDGVLTVQQGGDEWSSVDVPLATGGGFEWTTVPGWIEVGIGPEDAPPCRAYVRETGLGDAEIRAMAIRQRHR